MKLRRLVPLSALLTAAIAAGCGSSGDDNSSTTGGSTSAPAGESALAVNDTSLGGVLVDSEGRTLYMFRKDTTDASRCAGACANDWPPAAAPAKPTVGSGVGDAKLKTIRRDDGSKQLSYAGHPLYRYSGDSKKGDLNGQGLDAYGGLWYVVAPSGATITKAAGGDSSGSGGGYGGGGY
jgi:predicted lipoprotein with Yx(FWY)xxD motif